MPNMACATKKKLKDYAPEMHGRTLLDPLASDQKKVMPDFAGLC